MVSGKPYCYFVVCELGLHRYGQKEGTFCRGALSRHVSGQSGAVDLQRAGERVTPGSSALSRGLGKLAEVLASKPQLHGVVERLYDSLRKGRRLKRSIRFA